jgi:hypothetical protein
MASRSTSVLSLADPFEATCSILESIVVGLIGALLPFLSVRNSSLDEVGPVDWLPNLREFESLSETFECERFREGNGESRCMLAQMAERGSRIATEVKATVPASGKELMVRYSRTAKMAIES